jgi:predicted helicase
VPKSGEGESEYVSFPSVKEIFNKASTGVLTAWDELATDENAATLNERMRKLQNPDVPIDEIASIFHIRDHDRLIKARRDLNRVENLEKKILGYAYRPFDCRQIVYCDAVIWRTRTDVLKHMLSPNLALTTCRQTISTTWQHVLATESLTDDSFISNRSRERTYVFPLYTYGESAQDDGGLPTNAGSNGQAPPLRGPNFALGVLDRINAGLGFAPTPEQVLAYIYAVLYSPTYRTRYAEFLKVDFPRIPFTKDRDTFLKLAHLGQQLIDLHLMRSSKLDNPISRFCGKGDSAVTKVEYDADRGRVSINSTQYFDGVTPDVWSYQIGGYQVLAKWLKDRKGRFLTSADTIHYSRIATAQFRTILIQGQIEEVPNDQLFGVSSAVVAAVTKGQ